MKMQLAAVSVVLSGSLSLAADGQSDKAANPQGYNSSDTQLSKEDEILLNNFMGAFENEIIAAAENQGELVGNITKVVIDTLVPAATGRVPSQVIAGAPSNLSATTIGTLVGEYAGDQWEEYAEEKIREEQRRDSTKRLPEAKEQIKKAQETVAAQVFLEKQTQEANQRRDNLIGPPRPNAFY
ncbi:MAG: hypothetical protein ABJL72_01585 [Roseobacter sp.]